MSAFLSLPEAPVNSSSSPGTTQFTITLVNAKDPNHKHTKGTRMADLSLGIRGLQHGTTACAVHVTMCILSAASVSCCSCIQTTHGRAPPKTALLCAVRCLQILSIPSHRQSQSGASKNSSFAHAAWTLTGAGLQQMAPSLSRPLSAQHRLMDSQT